MYDLCSEERGHSEQCVSYRCEEYSLLWYRMIVHVSKSQEIGTSLLFYSLEIKCVCIVSLYVNVDINILQ